MAQVMADPDEMESFLAQFRSSTDQLEETIQLLRNALENTTSWQDGKREQFSDALESLEAGVRRYVDYARDDLEPWLLAKIAQLNDYNE